MLKNDFEFHDFLGPGNTVQGANKCSIQNVITKFISRHQEAFVKFKQPFSRIVSDISSTV